MDAYKKEIQKALLKYGSFTEAIIQKGVLATIDFALSIVLAAISKFYKPTGTNFTLREAVFYSKRIDQFERYAGAIKEIQKIEANKLSILEVGAGGEGTSFYSNLLRRPCDFFLLDTKKDAVNGLKKKHVIIGDGCKLPFKDKTFDVVVSVDTLEHIPKYNRQNFFDEVKRVGKKRLIITCPLQSDDGLFQGKKYDAIFQYFYECKHGVKEPNTAQHIASSHPTVEEITQLPNPIIQGYKNCNVWLKYMLFSDKPFIGFFSGVLYFFFWKKNNEKPPYWGAVITSNPEKLFD
jgi:ubiquinone/menaquinone biosynthesis C-methylase UbiE